MGGAGTCDAQICESLEQYNEQIEQLRLTMGESSAAAEDLRREVRTCAVCVCAHEHLREGGA